MTLLYNSIQLLCCFRSRFDITFLARYFFLLNCIYTAAKLQFFSIGKIFKHLIAENVLFFIFFKHSSRPCLLFYGELPVNQVKLCFSIVDLVQFVSRHHLNQFVYIPIYKNIRVKVQVYNEVILGGFIPLFKYGVYKHMFCVI